MVKLLRGKNADRVSNLVYRIFRLQEFFTHIVEVNHPDNVSPCMYAMWHCHQMCIHGVQNRSKLNVLISRSRDGEIIAQVVEKWGFKTIRGSKGKKGAVEATMQMISALKSGENGAMMVDGPHGPARVVKDGVVKIAKMAGVPIVPIYWYSENFTFAKFPSWDSLRMPIFDTNLINLYGDPIYVPEDCDEEEIRLKLQASLEDLERRAPEAYKEVYKWGLWKRKRSASSQYRWNP
ncbi:lysophospholipid acyltransferase family protein [bacterium]|nr:lysophospholipid acyltransferase family protein [bacterium]